MFVQKHHLAYRKERYINENGVMHNVVIVPVQATRWRHRPRTWVWVRLARPGSAGQGKDKPSRCVGQARREKCPLVLKNTVRDYVYRSSFLSSFVDSLCRVRNKMMHVLSWQTVSVPTFSWALKQFVTRIYILFFIYYLECVILSSFAKYWLG